MHNSFRFVFFGRLLLSRLLFENEIQMEVMTCRYIGLIGVFISVFFFSSCDNHRANREMKQAEEMMAQNPDSARAMLENMGAHHLMNEKSYAHWCMLLGRVRDEQQKAKRANNPLSTRQWLKAQAYYDRKGTPQERAEIRLYTGRSQKTTGSTTPRSTRIRMDFHWLRKATIIPLRVIYRAIWLICIYRRNSLTLHLKNTTRPRTFMPGPATGVVKH